jgi:hypothetical protein
MKIRAKDANEEIIEIEEQDSVSIELTDEELASLKKLLSVADKLLALVSTENTEEEQVEDADEEEQIEDSEEENEKKELGDSFKSIGAVHQKKKSLNDSETLEQAINNAWAKRYGGK